MPESSSDSDSYDQDKYGPTTRRAWSDWCSNKGKSSQSEEENAVAGKVRTELDVVHYSNIYDFLFIRLNVNPRNCDVKFKEVVKLKIHRRLKRWLKLNAAGLGKPNLRNLLKSTDWISYTVKRC